MIKGHSVACSIFSGAPLTLLSHGEALFLAALTLLALSILRLAHSPRSIPHGTVEIHECVHAENATNGLSSEHFGQ